LQENNKIKEKKRPPGGDEEQYSSRCRPGRARKVLLYIWLTMKKGIR